MAQAREKDVMDIALPAAPPGMPQEGGKAVSDQAVFARLHAAIVGHRLKPGAKLGEEALCEVFGVSRAQIRRILLNLAHAKLIELRPNRGAYVAQPSVREARHVFEARRAVEAAIVERAVDRVTEEMIEDLAAHIREEQAAHERGDQEAAIRLSGAFHLHLARIAGNEVLLAFLEELVSRTSLIIATYGTQSVSACSHDDHEGILQALRRHDAAAMLDHMDRHLRFIEEHLQLIAGGEAEVDLRTILSE